MVFVVLENKDCLTMLKALRSRLKLIADGITDTDPNIQKDYSQIAKKMLKTAEDKPPYEVCLEFGEAAAILACLTGFCSNATLAEEHSQLTNEFKRVAKKLLAASKVRVACDNRDFIDSIERLLGK